MVATMKPGPLLGMTNRQVRDLLHLQLGPGQTFYVNGNYPNTGEAGRNAGNRTIKQALTKCQPYRGDRIIVQAGHVETITAAGGLDLNVPGVSIIGLGERRSRPRIEFTTSTAATMLVSARDVSLFNMDLVCGINAQVVMVDLTNAYGFLIEECRFMCKNRSVEPLVCIQHTDLSLTNFASADPWTTITTATGGLTQDMVGASFECTNAGTNFSTGRYTILTVGSDGKSFTVDRAAGSTGAASSGQGSISRANGVVIRNCEFTLIPATAAATECIEIAGMCEDWIIEGNRFDGDWEVGCISAITLKSYNLVIVDNLITNRDTSNVNGGISIIAATTGFIDNNKVVHLYASATQGITDGDMHVGKNYVSNEIAKHGLLHGTIDT